MSTRALIPTTLLLAAAVTACGGGETTPESMTVDAEVMCEDFVQRELDTTAEFSGTEAAVADADVWTYEVTGDVTHDGASTSYTCTVATDESSEEWTLTDLTFE
ncbi:hypothetical protein PWG71_26780 [Nocardiopsis sp. N85]|uniref:hypothetical protein n=1 Tax=Nocardiopsis sp. N85 TaxID=3029400 RepID=UPI00237F5637|nr:hypothetical protein [Nocardiopsis sp. N85]MDE3725006.1 hypothetical protein [Nocardiopsis sp. N85]